MERIKRGLTMRPAEPDNFKDSAREDRMHHPHAVALKLLPYVPIDCRFWLTDDCWNASADELGISVQAGSFEQAKRDLELEMGLHIEMLLQEHRTTEKCAA